MHLQKSTCSPKHSCSKCIQGLKLSRSISHYLETFSIISNYCLPSVEAHPKNLFHVFVHHIGDADRRDDLEEVWRQASVQPRYTFVEHDVFKLPQHGQSLLTLAGC